MRSINNKQMLDRAMVRYMSRALAAGTSYQLELGAIDLLKANVGDL